MNTLSYCQNGLTSKQLKQAVFSLTNKPLDTVTPEYPKRILYKGIYVTLFTDELLAKMNAFRIDYAESFAIRDSLTVQNFRLENIVEDQRTEIFSLRTEVKTGILLTEQQDVVIEVNTEKILGLEKTNKKLRRKTGLLGGVVVVLAVITTVVALN